MRQTILTTTLLILLLAARAGAGDGRLIQPGETVAARVIRVTDGDSLVVECRGLRVAVRLAGVNCPEWDAHGGKEAADYTRQWLAAAQNVTLEAYQDYYTKKPDAFDRYGRLLAWVWRDGRLLQEDLVHSGHAEIRYIKEKDKHYARLQAAKE